MGVAPGGVSGAEGEEATANQAAEMRSEETQENLQSSPEAQEREHTADVEREQEQEPAYEQEPEAAKPVRPPAGIPQTHRPKPTRPADFRPADASAIHDAVVHATEIAESLKEMVERIDEILELVEVAERQKLADERELDNLRRAMRRIQPPRQMTSYDQPRFGGRGDGGSRDRGPRHAPQSGRQPAQTDSAPNEMSSSAESMAEPSSEQDIRDEDAQAGM